MNYTEIKTTALFLSSSAVYSVDWLEFDHKTYLGGYYFAVCEICLEGSYNNDTSEYTWQCNEANKTYEKGCAKGIWEAFTSSPELTEL